MSAAAPVAPADGRAVKAACCDLWAHPGVRLLAGDALRPGGLGLTRHALDLLALPAGARVLDVGCGPGATLGELATRGLRACGVDYSASLSTEAAAAAPAVAGDAERLPLRAGSFDAVVSECVLSTVPDKRAALAESSRVLAPGGGIALSDVTREGTLPPPLDSFVGWVACAAGALPLDGYTALLEEAGFVVRSVEDHREALTALVAQARRRLALLLGALGAGFLDASAAALDPQLVSLGDALLGKAADAVAEGTLGYGLIVARRR